MWPFIFAFIFVAFAASSPRTATYKAQYISIHHTDTTTSQYFDHLPDNPAVPAECPSNTQTATCPAQLAPPVPASSSSRPLPPPSASAPSPAACTPSQEGRPCQPLPCHLSR